MPGPSNSPRLGGSCSFQKSAACTIATKGRPRRRTLREGPTGPPPGIPSSASRPRLAALPNAPYDAQRGPHDPIALAHPVSGSSLFSASRGRQATRTMFWRSTGRTRSTSRPSSATHRSRQRSTVTDISCLMSMQRRRGSSIGWCSVRATTPARFAWPLTRCSGCRMVAETTKGSAAATANPLSLRGCGGWIRTSDLWVMRGNPAYTRTQKTQQEPTTTETYEVTRSSRVGSLRSVYFIETS